MKHKEIEVWVKDNQTFSDGTPIISMKEQHGYSKAKLIIPVEPEIVEFEIDGGVFKEPAIEKVLKDNPIIQKLSGRRWKCRFEEIV